MRCLKSSYCQYDDKIYKSFTSFRSKKIGCDKECYCDEGEVICKNRECPHVWSKSPTKLNCWYRNKIGYEPNDECCRKWMCY